MSDLFDARPVTLVAQIAAAKREVLQRARVYPRLVLAGKMTRERAEAETEAMKAIVSTLEAVAAEEAKR